MWSIANVKITEDPKCEPSCQFRRSIVDADNSYVAGLKSLSTHALVAPQPMPAVKHLFTHPHLLLLAKMACCRR